LFVLMVVLVALSEYMMRRSSANGGGIVYDACGSVIGQANLMYTWKIVALCSWIGTIASAAIVGVGFLLRRRSSVS
jgi:hypothetical protein